MRRTKQLFDYSYANGIRVQVTDKGVTLWDAVDGRWVMDASCVSEDNEFSIADQIKEKQKRKTDSHRRFRAHYARVKKVPSTDVSEKEK